MLSNRFDKEDFLKLSNTVIIGEELNGLYMLLNNVGENDCNLEIIKEGKFVSQEYISSKIEENKG